MKVLLRSDIKGVGRRGDIVNVSSGHARNFLLPNDLAIVANAGTIAQAEVMRKSREMQIASDRESARLVAASLATTDRKGVQLEAPLRQLGEHSVSAEIFTDVVATLKINLVAK